MPFNFNKAQETAQPEVVINEKPQKGGLQKLGKQLSAVTEAAVEEISEKRDRETASNFASDYNFYQDKLDAISTESDMARLEAYEQLTATKRAEGVSDEEKQRAEKMYAYELDRITAREEQQGIPLEAEKRALVRKWTAIRPDMAESFQKTLTINTTLQNLNDVTKKHDARFAQMRALEAQATANGETLEHVMQREKLLKDAAESTANVTTQTDRGKLAAPEVEAQVAASWSLAQSMMMPEIARFNSRIMAGDLTAAVKGQEYLTNQQQAFMSYIQGVKLATQKAAYDQGKPILLDLKDMETRIQGFFQVQRNTLAGTDDARNVHAVAAMQRDANFATAMNHAVFELTGMDTSFDATGKLAYGLIQQHLKTLDTVGYRELVKRLGKEGGLASLVSGVQTGLGPETEAFRSLRLYTLKMKEEVENPRYRFTDNQKAVFYETINVLRDGRLPNAQLIAAAGPVFTVLYNEWARLPDTTALEKDRANTALAHVTMKGYGVWKMFRREDIHNPESTGAQNARDLPDAEWSQLFSEYVEPELHKYQRTLSPKHKNAIVYDPTYSPDAPFKLGTHPGREGYVDTIKMIEELNDVYKAILNTRHNGREVATSWAKTFIDLNLRPEQEITSTRIDVTSEQLGRDVQGTKQ